MKNQNILFLAQILNQASTNDVDVKDAYKVLKWKSEIRKAQIAINEQRESIIKECFTEEERRIAADEAAEKTPELQEKISKFNNLYQELLNDETGVEIKTVSYESWHNFSKENDLKLGMLECEFEGVLFTSMEG